MKTEDEIRKKYEQLDDDIEKMGAYMMLSELAAHTAVKTALRWVLFSDELEVMPEKPPCNNIHCEKCGRWLWHENPPQKAEEKSEVDKNA